MWLMLNHASDFPMRVYNYYFASLPSIPLLSISKLGLRQLSIFFQESLSIAKKNHINMLIGSITNLWYSTSAAQQSINLFLLCSLFQCPQVVTPNLHHSLQAPDSLLLPSSWFTCIHSAHFSSCSRQTTVSGAPFPKDTLLWKSSPVNSSAALHISSKAVHQSHLPFLLSLFLFHSRVCFSLLGDMH